MFKYLVTTAAALTLAISAQAQSTSVTFDSGNFQIFDQNTAASNPLSGGSAVDGNGDVLQLGYFTGPNFTGTFIPLSGSGSANTGPVPGSSETMNQTSIGDRTAFFGGDGTFSLQLNFILNDPMSGNNLPAAGTFLAIRFYNTTTITPSSFYNTVSSTSSTWQWQAPGVPISNVTFDLNDPNLVWESIVRAGMLANTAFHTTIPVPEPTTYALLGFGAIGMLALRKRVKR